MKTYEQWKQFAKGRETVSVFFTAEDVFHKHPFFRNHREFIQSLFKEKGIEITRFGHNYTKKAPKDYFGLVFHRTDSDVQERTEVTAIIGVNAKYNGPKA